MVATGVDPLSLFPDGTRSRDVDLHSGLRMRVYEAGAADAPPVLCLHGFPELALSWRHQMAGLSDRYRIIAPDLRGYGHTDAPKGRASYRLEALTRDIVELMDALRLEKVHLVGHDWGAAIGWEVAQRYPTRLHGFSVLNGPPVGLMNRQIFKPKQLLKSWYIFYFQLPWLPEFQFLRRPEHHVKAAFMSGKNKDAFADDAYLEPYVDSLRRTNVAAINYYRAALLELGKPMLPVTVPVQIVWGIHDRFLGLEFADPDLYASFVDELRIVKIDSAGHWVQQEAPEPVNEALASFIGRFS